MASLWHGSRWSPSTSSDPGGGGFKWNSAWPPACMSDPAQHRAAIWMSYAPCASYRCDNGKPWCSSTGRT